LFKKVCIVGVGLIGGSLGLAIKKRRLAKFVVGVSRRKTSARDAAAVGAVDMATLDLREGVGGADLVILAGPVSTIETQIRSLPKLLSKNALVIDVGSSKGRIEAQAKKYLKKNKFVGCHPMAGLEKRGVLYSQECLFDGAVCFVTRRNAAVERFWKSVGAKPIVIGAKAHDAWVAQYSHLPHALAFALFQRSPKHPSSLKASNPSLRDLSRISKSDPKLWADIFNSNKTELLKTLSNFSKDLRMLQSAVRRGRAASFIATANRISQRVAP
jgi:prephenate dehydrogenase